MSELTDRLNLVVDTGLKVMDAMGVDKQKVGKVAGTAAVIGTVLVGGAKLIADHIEPEKTESKSK